eukprot:TRINITY_DN16642_c0_g2_i1.p1 TRINITY_DN16642_c0_g2~~TRINITY_DN16642_c0_g2_i1.p1  ORF type:complete len:597 (-),score=112.47 TRINITY_DN16642_c0_g2_i1:112-1902(-)
MSLGKAKGGMPRRGKRGDGGGAGEQQPSPVGLSSSAGGESPPSCPGGGPGGGTVTSPAQQQQQSAMWPAVLPPAGCSERAQAFMKTKMCKFFILGACTRGSQCQFAHNTNEMNPLPDLHCTKLCKSLLATGMCNDKHCRYAHHKDELRDAPQPVAAAPAAAGVVRGAGGNREGGRFADAATKQLRESGEPPQLKKQQQQSKTQPREHKQRQRQPTLQQPQRRIAEFKPHDRQVPLAPQWAQPQWPEHELQQQVLQQMAASGLCVGEASHSMQNHQAAMRFAQLQEAALAAAGGVFPGSQPAASMHSHYPTIGTDGVGHPGLHFPWQRQQLPTDLPTQDLTPLGANDGPHVVVKNTFLEFSESPPICEPGKLRQVASASGRLCSLGGQEPDLGDGLCEGGDAAPPACHKPVQINTLTLRSVSSHSLRSNLTKDLGSNNSLCSLATLAEDELLYGGAIGAAPIGATGWVMPGGDAAQPFGGPPMLGCQAMHPIGINLPFPDDGTAAHLAASGRLMRGVRLDALVEERTVTASPTAAEAPKPARAGGVDSSPFKRQVTDKSTQSTHSGTSSASSEVSIQGSGEAQTHLLESEKLNQAVA